MSITLFEERGERPQPWGPGPGEEPQDDRRPPGREPIFNNGVWYVLALLAVIVGGYALQSQVPETSWSPYAFAPADLIHGRWETALTAVFLHGSWLHALANAGFILAFGTPVARFLGLGLRGAAAFLGFYLLTGVLANLAYAGVHWGSPGDLVGASGAASALMAAAARIVAGQGWRLGPIFSRFVLTMGGAWLAVNVLIALIMRFVGGEAIPGAGGAGVAWEAHIAGFVLGLFLIVPFAWFARR